MSLDEKLFGFFFRAARRVTQRKGEVSAAAATLEPLRAELSIVASAVAEQRVAVVGTAGRGLVQRPRLLLPERVDLASEPLDNARAYLARVVHDAMAMRLQLELRSETRGNEALLASLLAVAAVRRGAEEELSGALPLLQWACALEHTRRAELGAMASDEPSRVLELLLRARLRPEHVTQDAALSSPARAWLTSALACAPQTATELQRATAELLGFVQRARVVPPVVWGGLDAPAELGSDALTAASDFDQPERGGSEKQLRTPERVRRIQLGDDPLDDNPIVHSFEKLHTAEEYQGGKKRADGEDELDEHSDALDELDLRDVTRSNERAGSYGRSDASVDGEVGDVEHEPAPATAILYDEWDGRAQRYRRAWCSVYEQPPAAIADDAAARATVAEVLRTARAQMRELSAELAHVRSARVWHNRQPDGPDVDIDAMIERHGALRSGHSPPDRLHVSRRRRDRDLAVMLLVDASLSTDSWVDDRRVLDVAKSALIVLGEVLSAEDVPTSIAAFNSQTRKHCAFTWLKGFEEPWSRAQLRVARLQPEGYTRIGPALRHATARLAEHPARARLLLLISDGKPTDYDRYEGRYGLRDVRKALAEAQERDVHVFALAIDKAAGAHLPAMFGRGSFEVLPRPDAIARALTGVYADLLR